MRGVIAISVAVLLLVSSCATKQRVVQVPIRESVQEQVRQVALEGDSTTLRMVFEHPLSGIREVDYQQGKNSLTPDIRYRLHQDTIVVVAEVPEQVVEVVEKTVYQEVPIEVEVEREVNVLCWWQKVLMWMGVITLLYIIIRIIVRVNRR